MDAIYEETVYDCITVKIVHDDDFMASDPRENRDSNLGTWVDCSDRRASTTVAEEYASLRRHNDMLVVPVRYEDHGSHGARIYEHDWHNANGFYWVPLDRVRAEWSDLSAESIAAARKCLLAELSELDSWLQGDVYGFVVESPEGEHESCWGFICDFEGYVLDEARGVAQYLAEQRIERWCDLPEWVQATVLIQSDLVDC